MGAALALAIMLVVVVGIVSLAVNAQGPFQTGVPIARPRPGQSAHPGGGPTSATSSERQPRRPARDRGERSRDRQPPVPQTGPTVEPGQIVDNDASLADLKPLNSQARALVISVVDERTLGPVTRSRLTLRVEPGAGEAFEVTTRVAFPTPQDRSRVKVGASIPVRYDSEDHRRVVVDMDLDAGA